MERVGGRYEKMEGHCSTGQSTQCQWKNKMKKKKEEEEEEEEEVTLNVYTPLRFISQKT